jgi:hypothetical protein
MPFERKLEEVLGAVAESIRDDLRKVLPATVLAVHPDKMTVDVVVGTQDVLFDEFGNTFPQDAVSFSDVPLGVVRGGGFMVWVPVIKGDSVLLVFSDLSSDTWRSGDGTPQTPGFLGKHTSDSPFAIPMFAPDKFAFQSPQEDAGKVIIGQDGGTAQIRIGAGDIELGHPAGDYVALANKVNAAISTIVNAFNSHTHPVSTTGSATAQTGIADVVISPISPAPSSVASTLVKCS